MNRGFSLIEFVVASTLFLAFILAGFRFLDNESYFHKHIVGLTRPEAELNYRRLVVRNFFGGVTERMQRDAFLSQATVVFPDLNFGRMPETTAFSVACPTGDPARYARIGNWLQASASEAPSVGTVVLLAGADADGNYCWDYRRVEEISLLAPNYFMTGSSLSGGNLPDLGTFVPVELQGLAFRDGVLYWVQPSGEMSPFLKPLDQFQCNWNGQLLEIEWRSGRAAASFEVHP